MEQEMKLLILPILALIITGCATEAKKNDAVVDAWKTTLPAPNADYGAYPENYETLIKQYFSKTLKDPESVRYSEFSTPRKEHAIKKAGEKLAIYGYSACVLVNAKNSYGGYTGNKQYWFLFRNGEIVRSKDTSTKYFGGIIYRGRPINCQNG